MPNLGTESATVQQPMIRYAGEMGWTYVPPDEALALRGGENGTFFARVLEAKLLELNGWLTKEAAEEVVRRIEAVRNNIEGNAEILSWLRGEQSVLDETEKRRRNVTVVDFDNFQNPGRNVFQVTDEWRYTNGPETNRADVTFLVNGLPVAIVETKSAAKPDGMDEALVQIRRYHRETPEMLTSPQVFDITHLLDFYYGATWSLERKNVFNWREESAGNFEQKVKGFFDRARFLRMLKEWILFYVKDDELRKTILRQHQTRAVGKILQRCADATRKTGLIWHTQGSGKTFTMISAACRILENKDLFGKATVILMIDRNELEGQLAGWVERIFRELRTLDVKIEQATSKKRLRELLASDFRGLIISMIHKFEGMPKDLCTRSDVFVMIDEAHRSVGGDLGNYLLAALPNAKLFGFTGTPIDKTAYGKGTFKIFGKQDQKGYLDKYSILESIQDGTTVELNYTLAANEVRAPKEDLEREFLALAEAEGVSDVDELNRILDRAVRLKTFLKSEDRVSKVAAAVATHFRQSVEPLGYKAILVGVDREACVLYKEALDKLLPPEYCVPVYTPAQQDSEKYPKVHKHQLKSTKETALRKDFLKPDKMPKILIVTDKLLTGFDAPILYCMYLDKPMRDHVLLQAIARVNRPYEDDERQIKKPCGLVVDFVGIFDNLKKALAFDPDEVEGVIRNLDVLLKRFIDLMTGPASEYLPLTQGTMADKAVERAIDAFAELAARERFFRLIKELTVLHEILSPSPDLRDYVAPLGRLCILDRILRNAYRKRTFLDGDVARKTERLVKEQAVSYGPAPAAPALKIDETTLKVLKAGRTSDTNKIINLVNCIEQAVADEAGTHPYIRSIGDRAEAIMEGFESQQVDSQTALRDLGDLVGEILEARKEFQALGFDGNVFTLYWLMRGNGVKNARELAPLIDGVFRRFVNYLYNTAEMRQLKAELYRILLPVVGRERMIPLADKILKTSRL